MNHFFRYSIYEEPPSRYLVNPVRVVQAFLCLGCLGLAIYLIIEEPLLHLAFKVILGVTAAAFATITIIDVISNTHYDPIRWSTWAMFAIAGALFFFLCTGLLFATYTGVTSNLVIGEILFGVTGIMFLLDAIYLLCAARKSNEVRPIMVEEKTIVRSHTRIVDGGHLSEEEKIETIHEHYEGQMYPPSVPPYEPLPPPPRTPPPCAPPPRKPLCRCPTTTTYGGTFYMSKDATPLPSPEPTVRVVCTNRPPNSPGGRGKCVTPSSSQIIEKVTEVTRIYPGQDGRMQLSDGTPLIPMQTETGELWYKSPEGVAYNYEGIPIVSPMPNKHYSRTQSRQQLRKNTSPRRITSTPDGKMVLSDGTIVKGIKNRRGEVLYKSADGVLYTSEGIPLASSPERIAKLEAEHLGKDLEVTHRGPSLRIVEHSVQETSMGNTRRNSSPQRVASQRRNSSPRTTVVRERSVERQDTTGAVNRRTEVVEVTSSENTTYKTRHVSPQRNTEHRVIDKSFESVRQSPRQASQRTVGSNSPRVEHRVVRERSSESVSRGNSPNRYTEERVQERSESVMRSPRRATSKNQENKVRERSVERLHNTPRSSSSQVIIEKRFSESSTPRTTEFRVRERSVERPVLGESHKAVRNRSENINYYQNSRSIQRCPEECPSDCHPFEAEPCVKEIVVPCPGSRSPPQIQQRTVECQRQCQYEPKEIITIQSSETITRTPRTTSRTVAVSTRMVPKASITREKCHSAPAPEYQRQVCQRPVKSAEYASQSSCRGENFRPVYSTKSVVICSAASPCGLPNCTWCREEIAGPSCQTPSKLQHPVQEEFQCQCEPVEVCNPPQPLQTISECECETDPSSTWEQDQVLFTGSEFSSPAPTSYDNVREIDSSFENPQRSCAPCCRGNCPTHQNMPQVTSVIQTSETRMIRAQDLQGIDPRHTSF